MEPSKTLTEIQTPLKLSNDETGEQRASSVQCLKNANKNVAMGHAFCAEL